MCPPKAGLVPKYGQKLTALGRELGGWQLQGRKLPSTKNVKLSFLGAFPFLCSEVL